MGFLAIRQIKYVGDNYYYTSPILKNGMNVLKAPTRSGKSTFMRLIYYGLGGRVSIFNKNSNGKKSQSKHTEITEDTNNRVELLIEIDKRSYSLIRSFEKKQVLVLDLKAKTSYVYPIYRSADTSKIFSDWLLEKLDIVTR